MNKLLIKNIIISLIVLLIAIPTTIITFLFVFEKHVVAPESASSNGYEFFNYYTSQSNILVAIISVIILVFTIRNILQKRDELPLWLIVLFLVATTATTVTLLTTALYLAPTYVASGNSYFMMFKGRLFFLHFLTPILAIILIIFLLNQYRLTWKHGLLCILSVATYSCLYVPLVVSHVWIDFYGFTFGGKLWAIPIALAVMLGVCLGLGLLLVLFHNLFYKKSHKTLKQ